MFVVVWLIICGVVAGYANSRGRSAVGWFFLAALISPIIAGIALALSKDLTTDTKVNNVERRTDNLEQEVKFNQRYNDLRSEYMQKEIDSNRNTTERILISQTPQFSLRGQASISTEEPSFANLKMNAKIQCPKCGRFNKADNDFCSDCGSPLLEDHSDRCRECGAKLEQKYSFCPKCGAKQIEECTKCGLEVPAGALFCPSCGEKLAEKRPDTLRSSNSSNQIDKGTQEAVSSRSQHTNAYGSNMEFVYVKKGSFLIGNTDEESGIKKTMCELTYDFSMSKFPITFADYDKYCRLSGAKKPDDEGWGREQRPLINVSWFDAVGFCNWLSENDGLPKAYNFYGNRPDFYGSLLDANGNVTTDITQVVGYRLPTEAEWEYTARGGNESKSYKYAGSDNVDDVAWYKDNSWSKTQEVGKKVPNELGLYDMSGNVWEWCTDWYGDYSSLAQTNPYNSTADSYRVIRGGSWSNLAADARVAGRGYNSPTSTYYNLGFRICRTVP